MKISVLIIALITTISISLSNCKYVHKSIKLKKFKKKNFAYLTKFAVENEELDVRFRIRFKTAVR